MSAMMPRYRLCFPVPRGGRVEAVLCALMVSFDVPVAGGPAGLLPGGRGGYIGKVRCVRLDTPHLILAKTFGG